MSTGKHIGKVMLEIRDENSPKVDALTVLAIPRTTIHPHKSIIITGGLGGFGLEVAQWLVSRGANKIVLTSRSGAREQYHHYVLKRLKKLGVEVRVWSGEGTSEAEVRDVIKTAAQMAPVGAIFHLAALFLDALMENQTIDYFDRSAKTKILQCNLYDKLSRSLCPQLDYFVVFSSVVAAKGMPTFVYESILIKSKNCDQR
jgi:fatty acid synthase, animal type